MSTGSRYRTHTKRDIPANGFPEFIRGKYKLRILWDLREGPLRFGEIRKKLGARAAEPKEIAPRVLSRELRSLMDLGLVQRRPYNVIPPKVEYRLTSLGRTLLPVMSNLFAWESRHVARRGRVAVAILVP